MIARLLKLYFLFSITTVFLFACKKADEPIVYKYGVFLGTPKEYNLLFAGHRSYFYRQFQDIETGKINEKRVTTFPTMGDFIGGFWRNKSEVTAGSNKAEFPTGIYLHWYSLFEKQGWEIKYDFDEQLMGRINTHHFSDMFTGGKSKITHPQRFFGFNIYTMPKGLAYVYISGGGESYLLGELQANPIDVNFDYYRRTLHSLTEETAEDLFNRRLSYQTEEFQKAYHDGTLSFSTEKWERRMKRYDWELVGILFTR